MLHSKCDLFQRVGCCHPRMHRALSHSTYIHFPGTEGGEIRFTPHLWERKESKCLAELKAPPLPQDPRGGSSAGLPSHVPLVHSLSVATESISTLGMAMGRLGGRGGQGGRGAGTSLALC